MTDEVDDDVDTLIPPHQLRRNLYCLRRMWASHSPSTPFCLVDEVQPGLTVIDLCMYVVNAHRNRASASEGLLPSHNS